MSSSADFTDRLIGALSQYRDTIDLVDELLKHHERAQEIILLTCARLDSLANLAIPSVSSQQQVFRRFVENYSGKKAFFNTVSVGDLYRFLIYYGDLADGGLIEIPGRIRRFGPESDDFLAFVERSKIPITGEAVRKTTHLMARALSRHFRVMPRQSKSKPYIVSSANIKCAISQEFRKLKPKHVIAAFQDLLDSFKCSAILYKRYRNEIIHGLRVTLDEDGFFQKDQPYHDEIEYADGVVFQLEFPGIYLRNLLLKCLDTFQQHLLSKKKAPIELFNVMYTFEEILQGDAIDYLDDDALEEFEDVRWKLRPR
jgi:hypothetical protein